MRLDVGNNAVCNDVVELIPALRAYGWTLCRNSSDADDLVQETLLKALNNLDKYQSGTNLRAWLFTIMRNTFLTNIKRAKREPTGQRDVAEMSISVPPTQEWTLRGKEMMIALARLPEHYRSMLVLVVVLGMSYKESAEICGCAIGTVKSRVNRARLMLIEEMGEHQA